MNKYSLMLLSLLMFAVPGWTKTIVVDDFSSDCKLSGTWADNMGKNPEGKMFGGEGCVNGNYHYTSKYGQYKKTGREKATWTPNLPQAGKYKVEVTFRATENRSKKVTYEVAHSGGREKKVVNQAAASKVTLGVFSFAAGRGGCVEMVSDGGSSASVDSAQFTFVGEGGGSDAGTSGTSDGVGLSDILGKPGATSGSGALIDLSDTNPGEKQATLAKDGKLEAKVCLRTYGPATLKVTVNGEPWISWSRADDKDGSPCVAKGQEVADSIFMDKPGDPTAREVTLTMDAKSGDRVEASLEGGDGSHVIITQTGKD